MGFVKVLIDNLAAVSDDADPRVKRALDWAIGAGTRLAMKAPRCLTDEEGERRLQRITDLNRCCIYRTLTIAATSDAKCGSVVPIFKPGYIDPRVIEVLFNRQLLQYMVTMMDNDDDDDDDDDDNNSSDSCTAYAQCICAVVAADMIEQVLAVEQESQLFRQGKPTPDMVIVDSEGSTTENELDRAYWQSDDEHERPHLMVDARTGSIICIGVRNSSDNGYDRVDENWVSEVNSIADGDPPRGYPYDPYHCLYRRTPIANDARTVTFEEYIQQHQRRR
jgi:hypothetical protein